MTRQNQIPTEDGSKMTFALIPLWDMCNHCNGLVGYVIHYANMSVQYTAIFHGCKNDNF